MVVLTHQGRSAFLAKGITKMDPSLAPTVSKIDQLYLVDRMSPPTLLGGDNIENCKSGLFQDASFAQGFCILCIFGDLMFVPISWSTNGSFTKLHFVRLCCGCSTSSPSQPHRTFILSHLLSLLILLRSTFCNHLVTRICLCSRTLKRLFAW